MAVKFRCLASFDRIQERIELCGQRLNFGDRELLEGNLAILAHAEDGSVLAAVVHRDVLVGLKQAKLADAVGRNPAGGNVGYAAALKLQANVGYIDLWREDGDTGGADLLDLARCQAEQNIEVVDHQVEHDVDIEASRTEDAETVNFEKEGKAGDFLQRNDGRIEALEMSHLEDAAVGVGCLDELIGRSEILRDGLFNEYVDSSFQKGAADFGVSGGRNGDDGGVDLAGELAGVCECGARVGGGDLGGPIGVSVHYR